MLKRKYFCMAMATLLTFNFFGCAGTESASSESDSAIETPTPIVDFMVEVEEGRDPIVLQLADPQILDASQERTPDRLGVESDMYWAKDKKEERCYQYIRQIVEKSSPDLIIITGDIVYGEFDDNGSALTEFVSFMESFNIPWAPVFGNHENESKMGVDWQCQQFIEAKNCLFKRGELTGNGNYTVGIKQGDKLLRVFYMLDSNGCGFASNESYDSGRIQLSSGFARDQIDWYTDSITQLKAEHPEAKISMAFHIPTKIFVTALTEKYGFDSLNFSPIDLDTVGNDGDFGYVGANFDGWDAGGKVWNTIKELGIDSVFVGHEHCISSSVVYEGVRLQFGLKSSTYDALNYVTAQGEIVRSYSNAGTPIVGGTVIPISAENGEISPYHLLYEEK